MGKFYLKYTTGAGTPDPVFETVAMAVSQLPGDTYLRAATTSFNPMLVQYEVTVELENQTMASGTIVYIKYQRGNNAAGVLSYLFNGIDIVPPNQQPTPIPSPAPTVVAPTVQPFTMFGSAPPIQWYNTPNLSIPACYEDSDKEQTISNKCECGAEKTGSSQHSSWCGKLLDS